MVRDPVDDIILDRFHLAGAYGYHFDQCISDLETNGLLTGQLPDDRPRCHARPAYLRGPPRLLPGKPLSSYGLRLLVPCNRSDLPRPGRGVSEAVL